MNKTILHLGHQVILIPSITQEYLVSLYISKMNLFVEDTQVNLVIYQMRWPFWNQSNPTYQTWRLHLIVLTLALTVSAFPCMKINECQNFLTFSVACLHFLNYSNVQISQLQTFINWPCQTSSRRTIHWAGLEVMVRLYSHFKNGFSK